MIINYKPTYKCDHCKKLYQIKSACEKHERACSKNPENERACFGCIHLRKVLHVEENEYTSHKYKLFFCDKFQQFVHPAKVEHKGNAFDTGEYNLPMPKVCGLREEPKNIDEFLETLNL